MKAFVETWGCQMNRQEGALIEGLLSRAGLARTTSPREADVIVLETCAIRAKAEEKVYSALGAFRKSAAADGRRPRLVVAGCVAEKDADRLVARFGVDLVLGPRRIARIADLLPRVLAGEGPLVEVGGDWVLPPEEVTAPDVPGVSAFVTVMQGCSNGCSFCVVPSRRGEATSRPCGEILKEVLRLEGEGYSEVTLLGQNISYWGMDRPGSEVRPQREDRPPPPSRLADLLSYLHERTRIPRIRFATSHPLYLDDRFIEAFASLPRVMPHLHVPAQTGSNRILSAMRRGYTVERYLDLLARVRMSRPETAVTTDLIAGFPGETEEDHSATLRLVETARFAQGFVYAYSERPATSAAGLGEAVPRDVRRRRSNEILSLLTSGMERENRDWIGRDVEVLVEASAADGRMTGRTPGNRAVCLSEGGLPGEILRVRVESATATALRARRAPAAAAPSAAG